MASESQEYPDLKAIVSRLSAFLFFTPIFGVLFGTFFLSEEFTASLMIGLPLVCLGIFLVNWKTGAFTRRAS